MVKIESLFRYKCNELRYAQLDFFRTLLLNFASSSSYETVAV